MSVKRFRTKPVEIEAVQYDGSPEVAEELFRWTNAKFDLFSEKLQAMVYDELHTTWINVSPGQWIIKGTKGEFYPCDPETFDWKYVEIQHSLDLKFKRVDQ